MGFRRTRAASRAALTFAALVCAASVGSPAVASAASTPTWGQALPAKFADGVQSTAPSAYFTSVSCASAGNCTAAGQFLDHDGNTQAFTQTSTNGVWANAVPAKFADGVQNAAPYSGFNAVSCTSPGNCTAAGQFKDVDGNYQAFTQTSTNGVWANAVPAKFTDGDQSTAPNATFLSVSCTSPGNCTAAGQFLDHDGKYHRQAFTATSTSGVWAEAVPAAFGALVQNSTPSAAFKSVSCTSPGNCTAAGVFTDHDGFYQAFTETSTSGVWAQALPVAFGTNVQSPTPSARANTVSCTSDGNCTTVGQFTNLDNHYPAFSQTLTSGAWAEAVPAPFGAVAQDTALISQFKSVSCTSAGNCTAAGYFKDPDEHQHGFTQTSTNGVWADPVPSTFTSGVQNVFQFEELASVSCSSVGNCAAAGYFTDHDGHLQAFAQISTDGSWAQAVPAAFADGVQSTTPDAYFNAVSCGADGDCTAVGLFLDHDGNYQAFTQSSTQEIPLLPPTGADTNGFVAVAVVLLAAGAALVTVRRRRHLCTEVG